MSEVKKKYFQQFSIPLNRQASEKVARFLSSYKNSRYTDANDSTGTSTWYAVYAKRNEAGLDSGVTGVQQSKIATHIAVLNEVEFENKSLGGLINGDYELTCLYGSQRANQKGNIILPLIQSEKVGNSIFLTKKDQPIVDQELVKNFADFSVEIVNSRTGRSTIDPKKLPLRFTISGKGGFFDSTDASLMGHHLDMYYGDDFQSPLQGPFTEQHVGGYKHRHTEIGQTDDRPELYKIENYGGANKVQIFNPRQDFGGSTYDMNIPRVKFSREELVKRAYNIRNVKTITGSQQLGNFTNNYEVVNTNGRRENNLAFRDQGGFNITGSESTAVSGVIDFALPNRALSDGTYNKTVIVNRFSAPGEVATLSKGYLDVESSEYSPYNALPYRNREVVNNFNEFLKIPSAFGGFESGSTTTGSFHKVQRNRVNKLRQTSAGVIYTGSQFDNGFVAHNIPRKDFGYRWITSSADPSLSMDGLYGFATSSDGVTFLSGTLRNFESSVDYFINFVGISTPGEFSAFAGYHFEISEDENLLTVPTSYTTNVALSDNIDVYFLNINGPYGYPSFKQVRTGQHPVARYLKRNNFIISNTDVGGLRINHSPVSSKYKPVIHNVKSEEVVGGEKIEKDLLLYYTYANDYDFYGNYYDYSGSKIDNPNRLKNFKNLDKRNSLFNAISSLYTKGNNAVKLNSVVYGETIYPKETNTYLSKVRDRSRFVFNWRDSITNRANKLAGSQGTGLFSYWAMDKSSAVVGELLDETSGSHVSNLQVRYGRYKLSGSLAGGYTNVPAATPKNTVQFGASDSANQGPFNDSYSVWNKELRVIAKDHSIIPEYRISEHIGNIIDSGYDFSNDSYQSLSLTGSQATSNNEVFLETYSHSDNIPAIEIVRQVQERDSKRISINLSAAKKLLPYDGFYPVQRTLQLSTLFSQSVGPDVVLTGTDKTFQTINNVVFSRLTYGSIRAGVAIDSANWISGSIINPLDPAELNNASNQEWNRIPFEAIIDPASYLNVSSSIIENDHENRLNSTASVGYIDSKYGLAASNFYAGVVDTFIENSVLTSIKSRPSSEWTFSQGTFNNYSMDIVVSKKSNFTNHDDPSANGYPYPVHTCFYQPMSSSIISWIDIGDPTETRVNLKVPPAASWSSNEAIVTINFDYGSFRTAITEREPTLNDILSYSTKTYKNKQMVDSGLATGFTYGISSVNSSSPFMTIEAGVDLFASNNKGQWTPTLKWECPTHNYTNSFAFLSDGSDGGDGTGEGNVNRGIWHQYSTDTNSGLELFARGPETETARTTGSLTSAVGFETEQKVISQLATSTQLKEYLVVVPFVTNECEEETFFHYPIGRFERAYNSIETEQRSTLSDMLSLQRDMILPPKLNYMLKRDSADRRLEQDEYGPILPPFAMYIFEVTENLSQEDLSKWWQGILPSAGTKVSMEKFNITHEIKEGEIISPSVLNNDLFGGRLPKEMRFKVFKAKYKRNLTYNEIKNKSIYGTEPVNSIFGYNYPHDFYSLIEMAKVDLGLEYDGDKE
tara:strand:+ start:17424 stop:21986 length:4563 start_codon:yes stop_codon:yes gene_type:complete